MLKVAILGANGFIGSRAVEFFHLNGLAEVRPVVRSMHSLARLSRFDLDSRVADAFDQSDLRMAFKGCDVIINAIAGDRKTIVESITPVYRAAEAAGVRRIVYLSSASVHGQSPDPGTNEKSPLNDQQPLPYNNSKVHAEKQLKMLREKGSVEIVILRPGIVFGPRSFWVSSFASQVLKSEAYMVNDGKGICNSIYIDNLIQAIYLACTTKDIDGEAFIIGDDENITWQEFYQPIANALGLDMKTVHNVSYMPPVISRKEKIKALLEKPPYRTALSIVPAKLLHAAKATISIMISKPPDYPSPWAINISKEKTLPTASLEMTLLYQCQYKLPDTKAREVLGYRPIVPFTEACRRTIGWLAFAGYPVLSNDVLPLDKPI